MDPIDRLKEMVEADGVAVVADKLGFTRQAVYNAINGVNGMSDKMVKALGFERIEVYRESKRKGNGK